MGNKYRKIIPKIAVVAMLSMAAIGIGKIAAVKGEVDESPQAVYDIGSISKVFTATAVMQLVDQKKIDLDLPITTYLPEFQMADELYQKITTRMLLNHTSGLLGAHIGNAMLFDQVDFSVYDQLLNNLKEQRLQTDPGSYASYSNDGFTLAEMIVERVTNMTYSDYLMEYIFQPLGMDQSSTPALVQDPKRLSAKCYINGTYEMPHVNCNCIGSGGIMCTTEDLCKFSTLFMKDSSHKILSKESASEMRTDQYAKTTYLNLEGSQMEEYGLGFDTVNVYPFEQNGVQIINKGGSVNYHMANLTIAPDYNCSVAVLSAGGRGDYDCLVSNAILEEILKDKGALPNTLEENKGEVTPDTAEIPDEIKRYAGMYSGRKWYQITFPTDTEMLVELCDEDYKQKATFQYTSDGYFINQNGYYFAEQKLERPTVGAASAKTYFKEESDGNVYLCSNYIMNVEGMGVAADKENSLKKQNPNQMSEEVMKAWSERMGKGYYPVYENYASTAWTTTSSGASVYEKLKMSTMLPGYITGNKQAGICRIIDQDTAQFAGLVSNAADVKFIQENGIEYLTIGCTDYKFIPEEKIHTYHGEPLDIKSGRDNTVGWYQIDDAAAGQQKTMTVKGKGAIYVYDHYHNFIYSTMMLNGGDTIVLPKDGTMALVGKENAEFVIQ